MRNIFTIAILTTGLLSVFSCSQSLQSGSPTTGASPAISARDVEQEVMNVHLEWAKADLTRDKAIVERILADDYVYTHEDGRVTNKEQDIAEFAQDSITVKSAENTDIKVRVFSNDFAVTTGDYHLTGRDRDGKDFKVLSRWTNVLVKRDGTWRVVAGHNSLIPNK
jgi:uncharacterized protein (TIGR02246 family)